MNVTDNDFNPTAEQALDMKQKIETLEGQLWLVDSLLKSLDAEYHKYLAVVNH